MNLPPRILFVDDDRDWRLMVTAALESAGYDVMAVAGAREALLQTGDVNVDLILLDLDLGGENGLMLMKHLKRHHPQAPVILFTGLPHHTEADVEAMKAHGAAHYLRKGSMTELLETIDGVLPRVRTKSDKLNCSH